MKLKTATIVANPHKQVALAARKEIASFLKKRGIKIMRHGEILITVGGDGTLLYNRDKFKAPIFGIGSEKSVICQAHFKNWRGKLAALLKGYTLERRMTLECEMGGRKCKSALNEVVVGSRDHRVVELVLLVGGKKFQFKADGVIFSTPTGSTGYAYSCGGPRLDRSARKYVLVAVAPYMRAFKPMVVDEKTRCRVRLVGGNADLVTDGQFVHHLDRGVEINVQKSSRNAELVLTK